MEENMNREVKERRCKEIKGGMKGEVKVRKWGERRENEGMLKKEKKNDKEIDRQEKEK